MTPRSLMRPLESRPSAPEEGDLRTEPVARGEIIDVEILDERPTDPGSDGRGEAALVLVCPPEPEPATPMFQLPPEMNPEALVAAQRQQLADMVAVLEGRAPAQPASTSAPEPQPEDPSAFLRRAMSLLDNHVVAMESTLERIVGTRWRPADSD